MSNEDTNGNGQKTIIWRLFELVLLVLLGVNTGLTSWTLNRVVAMSERISVLESRTLTQTDGVLFWRELALKANSADTPTPEVLRRLDKLENNIKNSAK